jgi:hypothetical protein
MTSGKAKALKDFVIEVRDDHGIPLVQARVSAPNLAAALVTAFADGHSAEWTFFKPVRGDELDQVIQEHL